MKKVLLFVALLATIALGAAGVVFGEQDDSPGLQGLGVLVIVGLGYLVASKIKHL